jgi:ubiquinone biosynthesis protein COQ9
MTDTRAQEVLTRLLPLVAEQGWTMAALKAAGQAAGETPQSLNILFPLGVTSALSLWQKQLDQQTIQRITSQGWDSDRIRDKIAQGVLTRLQLIDEQRTVFEAASRQRLWRPATVMQDLWHSAHAIWTLAGDTSSDYNRYTKRALLSKVLFKTTLSYLGDTSPQYSETKDYLNLQIEQIVAAGQKLSTIKPALNAVWSLAEKMGFRSAA